MTQEEFESRVKMKVSADEFERINIAYMNIGDNVDKDMFCTAWASWNKERISEYKAKVKAEKLLLETIDFLSNCYAKLSYYMMSHNPIACHDTDVHLVFTATEMRKLKNIGIFDHLTSYIDRAVLRGIKYEIEYTKRQIAA